MSGEMKARNSGHQLVLRMDDWKDSKLDTTLARR